MNTIKLNTNDYKYLINSLDGRDSLSFDTWGSSEGRVIYRALDTCDFDAVSIMGNMFAISKKSGGGCGMGAYPPTIRLTKIRGIGVIKEEDYKRNYNELADAINHLM